MPKHSPTPAPGAPADRSRRAQRATQEQIKELILDRGLRPGDPMPTEAELVDVLGVGRSSVREALTSLQAVCLVEIRHGLGTFVGDGSLDPFVDVLVFRGRHSLHDDCHEAREIIDVRQALEAGLIAQVAPIIDDDSVARLRRCLDELVDAGSDEAFADADRAFHEQLYAPLGNQLMSQLLRVFWDVYHDLSRRLKPVDPDRRKIIAAHWAIYDAVAARDGGRASRAMTAHFAGIRERLPE